ncbi:MAG: thrombospondin type 3 repeat-containing protein [Verrucomicrobia bacterium]|nr:thrombospondin type 3 repeat-containing protein [Verrucomicrobiota bacterium]
MKTKNLALMLALVAEVWLVRPAVAAVMVQGEVTSTGPTIKVNLYADIVKDSLLSFGLSLNYSAADVFVMSAGKNTSVWYLASSGVAYPYVDPDTSVPGQVVLLGARLDGTSPLQGVTGTRVLLGTVTFGRLTHNTPGFRLALGRMTSFANFVSTNGTSLDGGADSVIIGDVTPDVNDTKLAGIPDAWQLRYFGSVGAIWWSDDSDGDGFNNLQEYQADTNPTNETSFLGMSGASPATDGVLVRWHGGVQSTQVLQRRFSLNPTEPWVNVFTNLPPTVINSSHWDNPGTNRAAYYRITAYP